MSTSYRIAFYDILDPNVAIYVLDDPVTVEYTLNVNDVTDVTITNDEEFPLAVVSDNVVARIYRKPEGAADYYLEGDTEWLVRSRTTKYTKDGLEEKITAVHSNCILKWRMIAYPSGTTYADKTEEEGAGGQVIELMRQFVSENLGEDCVLSVSGIDALTLIPPFATDTLDYTAIVVNSVSTIKASSDPIQFQANMKFNGVEYDYVNEIPISLIEGNNPIAIIVTTIDGLTQKSYTVNVVRNGAEPPDTADLVALVPSVGALSPAVKYYTPIYRLAISNATASITLTPTTRFIAAETKINGTVVASGAASAAIPCAVGETQIDVVVTSSDLTTVKKYCVVVTRAGTGAGNAGLLAISLNGGIADYIYPDTNRQLVNFRIDYQLETSLTTGIAAPWRNLLTTLQDLSTMKDIDGQRVYFFMQFKGSFPTFFIRKGFIGADRTADIKFGYASDNVTEIEETDTYADMFNVVYGGGDGTGLEQSVVTTIDWSRIKSTVLRVEDFQTWGDVDDDTNVEESRRHMALNRPKHLIKASVMDGGDFVYGLDYFHGDLVIVNTPRGDYACHVYSVTVAASKSGEVITIALDGESPL